MSSRLGRLSALALALGVATAMGCSQTARPGPLAASPIPYQAALSFPPETASLVYDLPRQGGGPVTVYRIPVGELVQSYAGDYIGGAFRGSREVEVRVRVDDYRVRQWQATVAASFEVKRENRVVFQESYSATGRRQETPEDWAGPLEVKQQVDISNDQAMRALFTRFLNDARAHQASW